MRNAIALIAVSAVLVPAAVALGSERLTMRDAEAVTWQVVDRRYEADAKALLWPRGIVGCKRSGQRWIRCRAFLQTFRGTRDIRRECQWFVFTNLRGGQLYYRVGPTRCFRV